MNNEQQSEKNGSNPILEALTEQEIQSMTPTQVAKFRDGLMRNGQKYGIESLTPAVIRGQYEIVTQHVLPTDYEALLKS